MNRLKDKVAVIYSDGSVGSAVAKAFAAQGAHVFFAGRSQSKLGQVKKEVLAANGKIETAVVDAVDEQSVNEHMNDLVSKAGRIDISFNAIGIPQTGIQGLPLAQLSLESFLQPMNIYTRSHFLTSRAAVVQMEKQGRGVILMHVPNASRMSAPFVGGMIPAWASMEGLCRSLSVEYAPKGIRSICLLSTGIPETPLIDEVWSIHGKSHNIPFDQFHKIMEEQTHRKRLTTLKELTDAAVFAASDEGSAITGSVFNLTAGMIIS